jgi:hypothetical protein
MSEEKQGLSQAEIDAVFSFDNKTLDDYEKDALIDKGEYELEVQDFKRAVKVVDETNHKDGETLGDKIPYASVVLSHKKDKNGKLAQAFVGRRYEILYWDLRKETVRDEVGQLYRNMGYEGAYVPRYLKEEFVKGDQRRSGTFYIGKYVDSQTKREKNSRPRPVDSKVKKQERKDASGPVEI